MSGEAPGQAGQPRKYQLGIDIGGTFTDAVLTDDRGEVWTFKVPSTPSNPGVGFIDAVDAARREVPFDASDLERLIHATTVATNALIEGKIARVGLVVTAGFRDLLEIARQIRPDLFDLLRDKPPPLVPRERVVEVTERIGPRGEVLTPLDESTVVAAGTALRDSGVDAVVVCLLHSYLAPEHERRVGWLLRDRLPGVDVSLSSQIWPEFREYFRASTAIVNVAVRPAVRRYLETIEASLEERALGRDFYVMQSSGGVMSARVAKELPVQLIESGPAAGLIAAADLGRREGWPNLVSFDIGGTTAKVGLILGGTPRLSNEYEVGAMAADSGSRSKASGYPIRTPVLDLVEIGAGGGSLAWIDTGGALRVGPRSAGAEPGPACYDKGGTLPTLTDANAVLGRIDPDGFLGGRMRLDVAAAALAIDEHCARPLGVTVRQAAQGIVDVANASMVRALRLVTVQRGHDPRDFVLVAFGGAGPLHAGALAAELGFQRVVVPPHPGVLSARGLLLADISHLASTTRVAPLAGLSGSDIAAGFAPVAEQARDQLSSQGIPPERIRLSHVLDVRFRGQSYELPIDVDDPAHDDVVELVDKRFRRAHEQAYGYAAADEEIELVNWKVSATAKMPRANPTPVTAPTPTPTPARERAVRYVDAAGTISTHHRDDLRAGQPVHGPAVVTEMDATTFVPPTFLATVDVSGNLHLVRRNASGENP
jgi:N-methylhydantoinase A